MLKHTELTAKRIDQFLKRELQSHLYSDPEPLEIEFCSVPHATQKDAEVGPWKKVASGFKYGPAYKVFWFRVSGTVPRRFAGKKVGLRADVGGERTVWRSNSPWRGLDSEHHVLSLGTCGAEIKSGNRISHLIQAYSRNPQCRVHERELPREPLVEEVVGAELIVIDEDLKALFYDFAFSKSLLDATPENEPSFQTILRALNAVCNLCETGDGASIRRCRKILANALGSLTAEQKHTVIPVGHAHLDTAWLWPLEITHLKMAHTAANQLGLIDEYPDYVFVHSQASQYEWLEKEYPALFKRILDAIAKKQWEPVGSMWVEADCNLSGGESLVRQFLHGRRYFRDKLGYQTEDMWLPDVFGYSAALPQILAKFNIKYFLTQKISWNQINKFPHNTFFWQGIDGTKIWSHFPPADTYCGDGTPKEITESVRKYRDHARSDFSLYVYGFGDGGGGPTEQHIEFLKRARLSPALPDVQFGKRAIDFFREAKAQSRDLPTWSGELYFELHRGTYTSQAATKKGNRVSEFLLRDAEWLCCFTNGFPKAYPAAQLEEAWKLTLLNQFHDILPGSSVNEVYRDAARDYAKVAEIANAQIESALQAIGGEMNTEGTRHPVALFHNSTVASQATIPWSKGWKPQSVKSHDEDLPAQIIEEFGEKKLIFQTPVAALETVAIADVSADVVQAKGRLKAAARKIENAEWAVRFDGNGNILGVQSLEDGTEFIAPGKIANVFQIFDDQPLFWSAWDVDPFAFETGKDLLKSDSFEIVERGPVRVAAEVVKRFGKSRITQRISLGPTPGVRFDTEIDWHEEDKLLKVAFPVNINALNATYEIQYGNVQRPTHFNTSWDVARFEVPAQKWVDLSEGDQGVALINDCKYGYDVHGNVMRLTLLRAPKAPDPECDMGLHRFTYVLYPHFGPYNYGGVVQAAYAINAPVRSAHLKPQKGLDAALPPFVSVEDRNLVIESVKRSEDGRGMIVRLYECHNARGLAELVCARTPKEAWLCDLEENPLEELEISREGAVSLISFSYKPFEILTIKLAG